MKKVKEDVERCMSGLEASDRTLTSRFLFPGDFTGFQGHFPGKSILPGVCQIQCALSTLERGKQGVVRVREIVLAKYYAPVLPGEEVTCTCSNVADSGEFVMKAVLAKGEQKVAELKLRVLVTAKTA